MADIRSYMKEKEKREQKQENYKEKIARHKLASLSRILLAAAVLIGIILFFYIQYKRHIYTDYETIASVENTQPEGTRNVRLGD